jgi:hypothetical protein
MGWGSICGLAITMRLIEGKGQRLARDRFPKRESRGRFVVFAISHNRCRLIATIRYGWRMVHFRADSESVRRLVAILSIRGPRKDALCRNLIP